MIGRRIRAFRLRRWIAGKVALHKVLRLRNRDLEMLNWQAYQLLEKSDYEAASRIYDLIVQLWPESIDGLLGCGVCHQAKGNLIESERLYSSIIELSPRNAFAWTNRAEVRITQGQTDSARSDLESARELTSRSRDTSLGKRVERLMAIASSAVAET